MWSLLLSLLRFFCHSSSQQHDAIFSFVIVVVIFFVVVITVAIVIYVTSLSLLVLFTIIVIVTASLSLVVLFITDSHRLERASAVFLCENEYKHCFQHFLHSGFRRPPPQGRNRVRSLVEALYSYVYIFNRHSVSVSKEDLHSPILDFTYPVILFTFFCYSDQILCVLDGRTTQQSLFQFRAHPKHRKQLTKLNS